MYIKYTYRIIMYNIYIYIPIHNYDIYSIYEHSFYSYYNIVWL